MDTLGALVGEEIRAMAARKRLSISALARGLEKPQTYVARRVDGRASFTPAELVQVATVFGCTVADLLPREAYEVRPVAGPKDLAEMDLDSLEKLAAALGVTVVSLLPK